MEAAGSETASSITSSDADQDDIDVDDDQDNESVNVKHLDHNTLAQSVDGDYNSELRELAV